MNTKTYAFTCVWCCAYFWCNPFVLFYRKECGSTPPSSLLEGGGFASARLTTYFKSFSFIQSCIPTYLPSYNWITFAIFIVQSPDRALSKALHMETNRNYRRFRYFALVRRGLLKTSQFSPFLRFLSSDCNVFEICSMIYIPFDRELNSLKIMSTGL